MFQDTHRFQDLRKLQPDRLHIREFRINSPLAEIRRWKLQADQRYLKHGMLMSSTVHPKQSVTFMTLTI